MSQDRAAIGPCPKCNADGLTCLYNHFQRDELTIDAWEHKCPNCGFRETRAFRSDEPSSIPDDASPTVCPYCQRSPATAAT